MGLAHRAAGDNLIASKEFKTVHEDRKNGKRVILKILDDAWLTGVKVIGSSE